jgi:uncharacterized protein YjlB
MYNRQCCRRSPPVLEQLAGPDLVRIPNSRLRVPVYQEIQRGARRERVQGALRPQPLARRLGERNLLFRHFQSTAHELLGIVAGSAAVILGGPLFRLRRATA